MWKTEGPETPLIPTRTAPPIRNIIVEWIQSISKYKNEFDRGVREKCREGLVSVYA